MSLPRHYKENTDKLPGPGLVGAWLGALPQACTTAALLTGRWTPKPSRAQPGVTLLKWQSRTLEIFHSFPWSTRKGGNLSMSCGSAVSCCLMAQSHLCHCPTLPLCSSPTKRARLSSCVTAHTVPSPWNGLLTPLVLIQLRNTNSFFNTQRMHTAPHATFPVCPRWSPTLRQMSVAIQSITVVYLVVELRRK